MCVQRVQPVTVDSSGVEHEWHIPVTAFTTIALAMSNRITGVCSHLLPANMALKDTCTLDQHHCLCMLTKLRHLVARLFIVFFLYYKTPNQTQLKCNIFLCTCVLSE